MINYVIGTSIRKEEFLSYHRFQLKQKLKGIRMIVLIICVAILINISVSFNLPQLLLAIILPIIFFIAIPILNNKNSVKIFEINSIQFRSLTYEFTDKKLFINNDTGNSKFEWSQFKDISIVNDLVVITHNNSNGYLIPIRSFETIQQQIDVIEFVEKRLNSVN